MKLLAAINLVLRQVGQGQNNELDESSQDASLAKQAIIRARREILLSGHHFNTDIVKLAVGANSRVAVDVVTFLSVKFKQRQYSHRYDPVDEKTYVWDLDADPPTYASIAVEDVEVVFDIFNNDEADDDFEVIPEIMAQWIAKRAAAEYWYEVHQAASLTLEAKAERAKTRYQNSVPHTNIGHVTGFFSLRLRGNAAPTGSFDPRTQSHVFP